MWQCLTSSKVRNPECLQATITTMHKHCLNRSYPPKATPPQLIDARNYYHIVNGICYAADSTSIP
jgi:hypothetical protein